MLTRVYSLLSLWRTLAMADTALNNVTIVRWAAGVVV